MKRQGRVFMWLDNASDIDILFYHQLVINDENMQIPHPKLHLRRFILEPLSEIAPGFIHPELHHSVSKLLLLCPDTAKCRLFLRN